MWTKQTSCFSSDNSINYPSTNMFIKMTSLHFKIQFSNIYLWVMLEMWFSTNMALTPLTAVSSFCFSLIINSKSHFHKVLRRAFTIIYLVPCWYRIQWSIATQHIRRGSHKETKTSSNSCPCAARGVTLLMGVPGAGRWVVSVLPGGISESSRGRDRVWCRCVSEALVAALWGRGGGHRGGCHREGVLRGGREEAGVLCVFGTGYRPKVHLVGTPQKGPPYGWHRGFFPLFLPTGSFFLPLLHHECSKGKKRAFTLALHFLYSFIVIQFGVCHYLNH